MASYQNGTDAAYSYTYDANGNITEITQGTASFTYEYDKANQLVRENLYYGSGNSNNATYTYEYDAWGNILNKKKYAYTTGTLGSVLNTKTYSYTNSQWGDLLTSYNGSTITYDAMGNMATYGSKSYSWEGKQLVEINVMNSLYYTFAYDENGLRTSKTLTWVSDNTSMATEYYYNGSVLIGMKTGSTVMRFSYDASGNVVSADYSTDNGTNFTTYYYLRNAQNDIVKLIDGSGNTVVEYTYDSWGKALSVTGSLSGTLGEDQPFRYRGYVYDSDTQLYYLQSRYYDPKIGRFISADVLLSTGQGVIGHNSFAYCNNDPCNFTDDQGMRPCRYTDEVGKKPDFKVKLSKTRVERPDSELQNLPDEEIFRRARDKNLPGKERRRYQKQEKLRKLRNKQKRKSHYSLIPEFSIPSFSYTTYAIPNEQAFAMTSTTTVIVFCVIVLFGMVLAFA